MSGGSGKHTLRSTSSSRRWSRCSAGSCDCAVDLQPALTFQLHIVLVEPSLTVVVGLQDSLCHANHVGVLIIINASIWASEIAWTIDDGPLFAGFQNHTQYTEEICLTRGEHTLKYFDWFGDGWNGGWWEILNGAGEHFMGGPVEGQVVGPGGESSFTIEADGNLLASISHTITVHIRTGSRLYVPCIVFII